MKTISIYYNIGNISSSNMAYLRYMDGVWQWIPAPFYGISGSDVNARRAWATNPDYPSVRADVAQRLATTPVERCTHQIIFGIPDNDPEYRWDVEVTKNDHSRAN